MNFRYPIEEYSKISSKEYDPSLKYSQSMQLSHQVITEVLEKYCKKKSFVLEVGGGFGDVTKKLLEDGFRTWNVTNSPIEKKVLDELGLDCTLCDMHNIPYSKIFDVILCSHVFEHNFAPFVLFTEFNEVLKKDGLVVIIVPGQDKRWVMDAHHLIVPTGDHLVNLGFKTGFECLSCGLVNYLGMDHLVYVGRKVGDWKK